MLPRNKLDYPGNLLAPAFDPTHVAAQKCRFSGFARGNSFVNIFNNQVGSRVGSPTTVPRGEIGTALFTTSASNYVQFSGMSTVADPNCTLAAIITPTANSGSYIYNSSGPNGVGLGINSSGAVIFDIPGVGTSTFTTTLTLGVPYFVVASQNGPAGNLTNLLVMRLDTGKVTTEVHAGSATQLAPNGTYNIAQAGSNPANGYLACAMYSGVLLSITQMRKWAEDPWSFWYPTYLLDELLTPDQPGVVAAAGYLGGADVSIPQDKYHYPGGSVPAGFDPSHPMAAHCVCSAVAVGNGFANLLLGGKGTINGAPVAVPGSIIGPAVSMSAAASSPDAVWFTPTDTSSAAQITGAVIWKFVATPANQCSMLCYEQGPSNTGAQLGMNFGELMVQSGGANTMGTGYFPSLNVPYFAAFSANTATANIVVRRLDTGQIVVAKTMTNGTALGSGFIGPEVVIGNVMGYGQSAGGHYAAAMVNYNFTSLSALRAWAEDPWGFWYPQQADLSLPFVEAPTLAPALGGGFDLVLPAVPAINFVSHFEVSVRGTTQTYGPMLFGPEAPDRRLVAIFNNRSWTTQTNAVSVTIGGVKAKQVPGCVYACPDGALSADAWWADVPSRALGNVVVTYGTDIDRSTLALFSIIGGDIKPLFGATTDVVNDAPQITLKLPEFSGSMHAFMNRGGIVGGMSWQGAQQDYYAAINAVQGSSDFGGAHTNSSGSISVTCKTNSTGGATHCLLTSVVWAFDPQRTVDLLSPYASGVAAVIPPPTIVGAGTLPFMGVG